MMVLIKRADTGDDQISENLNNRLITHVTWRERKRARSDKRTLRSIGVTLKRGETRDLILP